LPEACKATNRNPVFAKLSVLLDPPVKPEDDIMTQAVCEEQTVSFIIIAYSSETVRSRA